MMNEIVLMADARIAAIPVQERAEPLVDVRGRGSLLVSRLYEDPAGAFAHLRREVADRLAAAQESLPDGLRLLIVEGYRPPALQSRYYDEYLGRLRKENPDWPDARLRSAASRYVSPPEIAPHSAGAAVDLTLADAEGRALDLGTRLNATPEESDGACYTEAPDISTLARANRQTLAAALTAAGLVNYPTEWWHWSFGDRYWALATGSEAAIYGPADLP
jgi:D-alanyl-D-alanine dipeptidase